MSSLLEHCHGEKRSDEIQLFVCLGLAASAGLSAAAIQAVLLWCPLAFSSHSTSCKSCAKAFLRQNVFFLVTKRLILGRLEAMNAIAS